MSAPDATLAPSSALADYAAAAVWNGPGLRLAEQRELNLALIAFRNGRMAGRGSFAGAVLFARSARQRVSEAIRHNRADGRYPRLPLEAGR